MRNGIALALVAVLMCVACGAQEEKETEHYFKERTYETLREREARGDATEVADNALADEAMTMEDLSVTEDFARKTGGLFVRKNGKLYGVGKLPAETGERFGVGMWEKDGVKTIYFEDGYGVIAFGEIPVVTLGASDELVGYNMPSSGILVKPARLVGPTIRLAEFGTQYQFVDGIHMDQYGANGMMISKQVEQFGVKDKNGEVVDNYRNLVFGEEYTVGWFEGTNFIEYPVVADAEYYAIANSTMEWRNIGVELHTEGYGSYDCSDLSPGYYFYSGCMFKVE